MRWWAWLGLYAVMTVVLLAPLSLEPHRRLPDDGDALQNLWIVWWGATHLELGYPEIYDANAYYPHPAGLVYSEPQFAQALLSWPFFNLLDNRVLAYNLLVAVCLCLTAFATHLFLRELLSSSSAAFVGAVLFAFSSYSFSQLPRPQLVSLQWLPLALLSMHRYFEYGRRRSLLAFVTFSVLLGLACFYYLQFYAIALGILVPFYVLAYRSWRTPSTVAWLGLSAVAIAVPVLFAAAPYFELFDRYGFTGLVEDFDLALFFQPPAGSLFYGLLDPPVATPDQFLGFIAFGLGGLGVFRYFRTHPRREEAVVGLAFLVLGIASFLLASGPDIIVNGERLFPGPYRLLQLLKPFDNLRDPARISVLTRLSLALFVAAGVASLHVRWSATQRTLSSALFALLILGEQWSPRLTRGIEIPVGDEIPKAYEALALSPRRGPVAEMPPLPFGRMRWNTLEAYFATFHERMILVGKPSFPPPSYELLRWELRDFPDAKSIAILQGLGIEEVVVHPKRWGEARARRLRDLSRQSEKLPHVESFHDRVLPIWRRWDLGDERLHAVAPLAREGSPRECDCREIERSTLSLNANGVSDPALAADGELGTKWTTGGYQEEGFFFEVAFDRPRTVVRIEIEMAFPYDEFARHLEVNGFRGQRFWRMRQIDDPWYLVALFRQLVDDPRGARLRYDLEPMEVDRLRMFIHHTEDGVYGWSIPEIHIYESRDPGGVSGKSG